jgi:hypothetical protein
LPYRLGETTTTFWPLRTFSFRKRSSSSRFAKYRPRAMPPYRKGFSEAIERG